MTGLGARRVKAVAAAKHHTVVATEGGDVFTWGSNRGNVYGIVGEVLMLTSVFTSQIVLFVLKEKMDH